MKIPFLDLRLQHEPLEKEILAEVARILGSSAFILGDAVGIFERAFAQFCGTRFAVGTGCGLDALTLAMKAVGIGPNDEVVVPANTFIATALAVSNVGAKPVLVDVDPVSHNVTADMVESVLTPRTRAVIPVHLYGQLADMGPLMDLASARQLTVIEDAAQAHGAEYGGRKAGSIGHMGCFSFYPAKNLGACGDAGAVVTSDEELARRIACIGNYGSAEKDEHVVKGVNSRMDTLQAAILNVKLRHLAEWNHQRIEIAKLYSQSLSDLPSVELPAVRTDGSHVYHLFVIRVPRRDALLDFLRSRGVGVQIHYPKPIHLQAAYRTLGHSQGSFPVSERLAEGCLSLPIFPAMSSDQVRYVAEQLREWCETSGCHDESGQAPSLSGARAAD